jgi:endonuclease YncB( thermonuclease family)
LIVTLRLLGINTPELHSGVPAEVVRAKAAKVALGELLAQGTLRVESVKTGEETVDKFGRYLAKIFVQPANGVEFEVGPKMIEMGHALPYFGVGPKPV